MNCSLKRRYSASYPEPVFFFFCAGFCFGVGRPFVTFSPACRGGGFLLKNPSGFSIDRLSPHALWFARFMSRATR